MIMFGSSLPSALGWLVATKVYSGTGADIVMESISPSAPRDCRDSQLVQTPVGVEKLFSGNFTSKIRSQVIECSFSAEAEIDRNYCFGSFFNSHAGYASYTNAFDFWAIF
jgi:hypothetical protein